MKILYPTLFLFAAMILVSAGRPTQSATEAGDWFVTSDTVRWTEAPPEIDSVVSCMGKGTRTRYYSSFYLGFSVDFPDTMEPMNGDSTWVLKFSMAVQLPGQYCLDTIPISALAESSLGVPVTILTTPKLPPNRDISVGLEIEVELILPIQENEVTSSGGLAIIVETIDPKTAFEPTLNRVFDWEAEIGDVIIDLVPLALNGIGPSYKLNPVKPLCSVCLP